MSRRTLFQRLFAFVTIFAILFLSGGAFAQGNRDAAFERVRAAHQRHTDRLLAMDGVEGTAVGYNANSRPAVHVFTAGPGVAGIPRTLDGIPVHVQVTGKFYALPKGGKPGKKPPKNEIDPTGTFTRPVPIGVSTGNEGQCSSGTIGCRVIDGDGNVCALSNNHVYALENEASPGSKVLQPGRYDTNCDFIVDNVIGELINSVDIVFTTAAENTVDAAIAKCEDGALGNATPADGYGTPSSTPFAGDPLGLEVQKYGRTTGLTKGGVTSINATVLVGYSSGTARFIDQIVITGSRGKFSNSGDSGSLVVTQEGNQPVGLLFAGSARRTIANSIDDVLSDLNVTIDGQQ